MLRILLLSLLFAVIKARFELVQGGYTFDGARQECRNRGGQLASIHSAAEFEESKKVAKTAMYMHQGRHRCNWWWLGATRFGNGWKWDDGTAWDWTPAWQVYGDEGNAPVALGGWGNVTRECWGTQNGNGWHDAQKVWRMQPLCRIAVAATQPPPAVATPAPSPVRPACPVSMTTPILTECSCDGEAIACAVNKFCYTGGCKDVPQCTVRADVDKNIFYGAKVYGSWNASTKIMSMNFTTPFDVQLNTISWKNAKTTQLKYDKSNHGLWTKDTTNACQPVYKLDVAQTTFFGDGSKFNIKGSQLRTNLRVDAAETVTTVKNGQTYTYGRSIKNTVPVLVNLVTKTTIAVRFRSTLATKGPGPGPGQLEDFVLFIAAEDNFATEDPHVLITMEVHSRSCVDHTLATTGVKVTTGIENIKDKREGEFKWTKEASGDRKRDFKHNLCVETLQWKFVPATYTENAYEIDLEFTLRLDNGVATGEEKFTTTAQIDIKQGDVLSDIGFTSAITPYEDAACTLQKNTFRLGQKFWTKIVLTDLVVPTHNITCNTYKIKQTKGGQTTETDLKNEAKYNFVEITSTTPVDSHICGAELESHHFHVSVDGYDTILETEILIHYDQTNARRTRRKLVQIPFTKEMWEAAGYDMEYEYQLGDAELSEEDLEFQNTKRAPDQDDMVVDLFVEAEKSVGIFISEGSMSSMGQMLMLSAVVAAAGYAFGFFHTKGQEEGSYTPIIEM